MKLITQNRKARHDYFILDTYEAGIILRGSEIKSIRAGKVNIQDSYVTFKDGEAHLLNAHISKFDKSNIFNHDETRTRKLLLNKNEIRRLANQVAQEGHSVVPLSIYIKKGLCKVEIALVKGKKLYDKRETLKAKDQEKRLQKQLKG
ncbi:MAG: SsrA-binding protein SmpB [Acholeplasmataceae bacterium]|jgi:SsrA-binding protein